MSPTLAEAKAKLDALLDNADERMQLARRALAANNFDSVAAHARIAAATLHLATAIADRDNR